MKAKKLKELASEITTTVKVAITGQGETLGYATVDRHNVLEILAMVPDSMEVDAEVEDEDKENQLTKIYFREVTL